MSRVVKLQDEIPTHQDQQLSQLGVDIEVEPDNDEDVPDWGSDPLAILLNREANN